jgi:hypothetical protein
MTNLEMMLLAYAVLSEEAHSTQHTAESLQKAEK